MFKFFKDKNKLHCFTPEVMLATFIAEVAMAVYVFVRYKMNTVTRLVLAILFILAIFQGVEYQICAGYFNTYLAKVGFVAVTLLPALGLHLISKISRIKYLVEIGYFVALAFIFYIIFLLTLLNQRCVAVITLFLKQVFTYIFHILCIIL